MSLPSALVRNRPDILAAEADLHADTARIGVATANLYPDIKLGAAWAQSAVTPGALFGYGASGWNIGPTLTAPIFNGGQLKADRRAAEAQARESMAQYQITVLAAFTQVSDVMAALAHDDERLTAMTSSEKVAADALHDARAAYSLGGGPLAGVTDAQAQLDRARLMLVEARGQRLMDVIQLYAGHGERLARREGGLVGRLQGRSSERKAGVDQARAENRSSFQISPRARGEGTAKR